MKQLKLSEYTFAILILPKLKQDNVYSNILWYTKTDNDKGRYKMFTDEMMADIVTGLREIFKTNIIQIILYGSVARDEAGFESDVDIAIILTDSDISKIRDKFLSWNSEMDMKYDRVFSIIDIDKANLEKWGNILPFYKNIKKEGVVLWKAA